MRAVCAFSQDQCSQSTAVPTIDQDTSMGGVPNVDMPKVSATDKNIKVKSPTPWLPPPPEVPKSLTPFKKVGCKLYAKPQALEASVSEDQVATVAEVMHYQGVGFSAFKTEEWKDVPGIGFTEGKIKFWRRWLRNATDAQGQEVEQLVNNGDAFISASKGCVFMDDQLTAHSVIKECFVGSTVPLEDLPMT